MTLSVQKSPAPNWGRLNNHDRSIIRFDRHLDRSVGNLPYGNGRSYGDTCHNDEGVLLDNRHNNQILAFDDQTGILKAQSGVLLADILTFLQDKKWFLPVVPGTKFVTLGGAIANDIHGKNHETRGTFGRHVRCLTLWRSDGEQYFCDANSNQELFSATIAGMGLTGVIVSAEIQFIKVHSHTVRQTITPFENLDQYFYMLESENSSPEYSVSWVDSLASGKSFGRGIAISGTHAPSASKPEYRSAKLSVPFTPPIALVSGLPLKIFNSAYYWKNKQNSGESMTSPETFFFPLDAIGGWNKLYGPRGLHQHQSVLPFDTAREGVEELMRTAQEAGQGSFLTVLKRFGALKSPGLLSFPTPGFTLTLDFANKGEKTLELLDKLDRITLQADGRTNPYKDARMSTETFQTGFPNWQQLEALRDPAFQSDFWRRVTKRRVVKPAPIETFITSGTINQPDKPEIQKSGSKSEVEKQLAQGETK